MKVQDEQKFVQPAQQLLNMEGGAMYFLIYNGKIIDTGERIQLSGSPTFLRSKPR
jgi:hypothetical protein